MLPTLLLLSTLTQAPVHAHLLENDEATAQRVPSFEWSPTPVLESPPPHLGAWRGWGMFGGFFSGALSVAGFGLSSLGWNDGNTKWGPPILAIVGGALIGAFGGYCLGGIAARGNIAARVIIVLLDVVGVGMNIGGTALLPLAFIGGPRTGS
jgi:hypothetical protein